MLKKFINILKYYFREIKNLVKKWLKRKKNRFCSLARKFFRYVFVIIYIIILFISTRK